MRVCVFGLGHLGSVTAACVAAQGHEVVGLDPDATVVASLEASEPPVLEPGLPELLRRHRPQFTTDPGAALAGADVLWLADDTPVDEEDAADVDWVLARAQAVVRHASEGTLVVVSSQLPVGSVASLERAHPLLRFACMPENLRLGTAVDSFQHPSRIVVGMRGEPDERVRPLLTPHEDRIIWMSIEAAELTKHALNAFLATSIAFANEIACICEASHADAREVELGLRSDPRVGEQAYLSAGSPFSGGTLGRDLQYLRGLGCEQGRATILLDAVVRSNDEHSMWVRRRLEQAEPGVVAVWGLAYKPGTDSIRRSDAVSLCEWLLARGTTVRAHDPAARELPAEIRERMTRTAGPIEAAEGADALVVAVAWSEYRSVAADAVVASMARPFVLDPARVTAETLGRHPDVLYRTVGAPA
jgi:UDPglucose 6-dehydrogenase